MTTHILDRPVFHPASNPTTDPQVWRMMCGVKIPFGDRNYVVKNGDRNYVVKKSAHQGWKNQCADCFNHPEIQLLLLARTDLGDE